MPLRTWEATLAKAFRKTARLLNRELTERDKARDAVFAFKRHEWRRSIAGGRGVGGLAGSAAGVVAFFSNAPVIAILFTGAPAYFGSRYAGRKIHDWIYEGPATTPRFPGIEDTIEFIKEAHAGQVDKAGRDYYHHPIAVMKRLPEGTDHDVKLAALLHDVLEDTQWTREGLALWGFSDRTLGIVESLTQKKDDTHPYDEKIATLIASGNRDAILVKFADISENTDPERLAALKPDDREWLEEKYAEPKKVLAAALDRLAPSSSPAIPKTGRWVWRRSATRFSR